MMTLAILVTLVAPFVLVKVAQRAIETRDAKIDDKQILFEVRLQEDAKTNVARGLCASSLIVNDTILAA